MESRILIGMARDHPAAPEAVLFDFHDTLAELAGGTDRVVAEHVGVEVDELRAAVADVFATHVPSLRERGIWPCRPDVMFHRLYEALFERLGRTDDPTPVVDRLNAVFWSPSSYRAYPDARAALDALHTRDLRLGLLSNSDFDLHPVLDHIGLGGLFDVAVPAFAHGVEKPDPAAFRIALEGMSVDPSRCWFVGDHPEFDAVASDALGMTAVLVDREDRHGGGGWPFPRIADLTPLPDMVGA